MRINDIQIDGFGVWKGLRIDNASEQLTVFYGRNEAGKTTLMQFVRSIMFGFSNERRSKYVPPMYGGLAGGSLHVITPHSDYEIKRFVDPNRITDPTGDLSVIDAKDGSVHGRATLGNVLNDIDEQIFNNVFAIGLREIQELNTLNSTEAADHLYRLTSGLDRVSLVDVMRDIRSRRRRIWADSNERPGALQELVTKRRKLLTEIDELMTRSRRWSKVAVRTAEIANQIEELETEIDALEHEAKVLEVAIQISDRWQSRRLLDEQIEGFGALPDPHEIDVKQLDRCQARIAKHRERIHQIKKQRDELRRERDRLPIDRQLWSSAAKIDAMCEHLPWLESMQRQAERLRRNIADLKATLGGEVDGLGSKLNLANRDIREIATRSLASLKTTGRQLLDQREVVNRAEADVEKARLELSQYEDRLESTCHAADGIPGTIDETGRTVTRLRRRIELEEKIEKLNHSRHQLERDIDDVVNEQVLPLGKLTLIGAVFILGVIFAGFGVLNMRSGTEAGSTLFEAGGLMMILGAAFGFFALAMKNHWERAARDELDDFKHQFDLVRQQLKRAKSERDEIERHLPQAVGDWDLQLRDAESQLARLENLAPLESRCKGAKYHLEEARQYLQKTQAQLEASQKQWRETLRNASLPESLQPEDIDGITEKSQRITGFHSRLEQYQVELAERERELNTMNKRVAALIEETGLSFETTDPMERIETLRSAIAEQRRLVGVRKELAAKYRSLRSSYNKVKIALEKIVGEKTKMLAAVGAATEDDYRGFHTKHVERRKLIGKRNQLTEQIAAALGSHLRERDIAQKFDEYGQNGLERRWEKTLERIDERKDEQTRLHQQRGEYLQEVKSLGEDSRLDEARLELDAIEQQIEKTKQQWQILGVTEQMLEAIRENYEAQRQPETLREASRYLERLSEGGYTRIWTRLSGEQLLVDNQDDESLSVDLLSRGTREAVYLALRLALVSAYAKRGAVVPLVLDDVLVNFDSRRAAAAAEVLKEFAATGYQILMFTCHDHIRDLFHAMDVGVMILPDHKDVLENDAVPVPYCPRAAAPAAPEAVAPEPEPVPSPPTEPTTLPVSIEADEFDPDLEYELTAIEQDQQNEASLRLRLPSEPAEPEAGNWQRSA